MRKRIQRSSHRDKIRWRSHEPSRLETFSDAVFAFALTLIILSLEVPKTFTELLELMKGAISFAASFSILFLIWNTQNTFFRRFGLHDRKTIFLNGVLLFVTLIYVYPLKFLSVLLLRGTGSEAHLPMIESSQTALLMIIYGSGYALIYLLFYLMYKHAESYAEELELTPGELFHTRTISRMNLINVFIAFVSITFALILPSNIAGLSGYVYFLIGPAYVFWYGHRRRLERKLKPAELIEVSK